MDKKIFLSVLFCLLINLSMFSQSYTEVSKSGKCGSDIEWSLSGTTLTLSMTSREQIARMPDYDMDNKKAPWVKQKLKITKVIIGRGIVRIGSCAFANCNDLISVEFNDIHMSEIGWGAFYNCTKLYQISIPVFINKIETIAFANCISLKTVKIPDLAVVEEKAFASCTSLSSIELGSDVFLGNNVFATEVLENDHIINKLYSRDIISLPNNVNENNCSEFGLSPDAVAVVKKRAIIENNSQKRQSDVDLYVPEGIYTRNNTYALVIGNQNYRFVPDVPFAKNDALSFIKYCKTTLGIPAENVHYSENATKHMILDLEFDDWLKKEISDKSDKNLIVYYAGHGVPDINNNNKAYLLPTDVYGTKPYHGIALDDFYTQIGEMGFNLVTIFIDACFSGVNRDNEGLGGERAVEIEAQDSRPTKGNLIVFSAAHGNETAQGFQEEGHGLFTYYLLKELQETKGDVTYGKLAEDLEKNVINKAPFLILRKQQTPTAYSTSQFNSWKKSKL